ncbi:response regulator transcription factor [Numidum massiliense]|uniref:response regulator transcription factor n=1 Tax=Numidum massiliense TaxID=1522315 RepID=UPI0006D52DE3|nr:response regulator transcription factor [Numidum massiliense]
MKRILYIEDELEIGEWVHRDLSQRGYDVKWLTRGDEAHRYMDGVDLVILDVMLPGLDGFTVGQRLKQQVADVPILMLSARTAVEDKLEGLSFADDYLTKPFHPDELAARVDVLLRRFGEAGDQPVQLQHLDIYLRENRVVDRETGEEVTLTGKEYKLLSYFLRHINQILTKEQLYEAVWDEPFVGGDNTIMVHIRHLRKKIERNPSQPTVIQTIRGLGYRIKR